MPYFICQRSKQKFKLSDEVCTLKKCPLLVDRKCTAQGNKGIKERNHEKKTDRMAD